MSKFQNWVFNQVHGKKLIYNTCWEDPRCDRVLLDIQPDSKIVMITSAGDNALDYLLDEPSEIHAVDMNYRQNALLEFKKKVLEHSDHETLFNFFGTGSFQGAKKVYQESIRKHLPDYAQKYWDKHLDYFNGKGLRKSFYYRGTSGSLAYVCRNYIKLRKKIKNNIEQMLEAKDLQEQSAYYTAVEHKIFNPVISRILNNQYTMYLAGVPKAQQALIQQDYEGGNVEYIKECFRNIFTKLDVGDNYFYQVYFHGHYTKDCCPEYLSERNFQALSKTQDRISTYTTTLSDFLEANPGPYSHYVLLDHQDWLAAHNVPELEREWKLILQNSKPGTRILMRSAATYIDFFPDFVLDKVHFDQNITKEMHQQDRVGTYASVYLGIVK